MKLEYADQNNWFGENEKQNLLSSISQSGIQIGSLLFAHNEKIIYEEYFGVADSGRAVDVPNSPYALNRMFSICKSFVAVAIGLLADEGKLSLSDHIMDYYSLLTGKAEIPDVDEGILQTTIEDMLTMRTSHSTTTYKKNLNKDWVESFFDVPSDKTPGISFAYDTSGTHVLCALCEKLTGMDMLDYLKQKMPELELSDESYIMKDPFGVSAGGSGLMCTTRDLLKFAFLIEGQGSICGKSLISGEYIKKATSEIADTSSWGKAPFQKFGYGYCFWRGEHGEYMSYGMWGQFICFYPDEKLILIATSDCSKVDNGEQILLDILWGKVAHLCKHLH